jgi:hypothetical protein
MAAFASAAGGFLLQHLEAGIAVKEICFCVEAISSM